MKATVCKKVYFDAAHYLPCYSGPCAHMHGHRWEVDVVISGQVDPATGMVMDFQELKEKIHKVTNSFDHGVLNRTIVNPTAENIAHFIWICLKGCMPDHINLELIRVWESPDSFAEVKE